LENRAERRSDLPGRENGYRNLIQQRLKQVMIGAIDQKDPSRRVAQSPSGREPRKSSANDYDYWRAVHTNPMSALGCILRATSLAPSFP
jgi:hypothetical protein